MDPALLTVISTNHSVIVFDQRGIGNSTVGPQPYTHQQLANDTAGLFDALNISKSDVVGLSLGSYLAQQFTIMHPDKVNSLTLVGSSCGGKDHTPKPAEFIRLQSDIVNKSLNNISLSTDELRAYCGFIRSWLGQTTSRISRRPSKYYITTAIETRFAS